MSAMLLSIKPKYAKKILKGEKIYEFRKSRPKRDIEQIIIYASSPQKEVVGEAIIEEIIEGSPKEIWEVAKSASGISKKDFLTYFSGKQKAFAYKLKDVMIYDQPKNLSFYGINQAPQSFVYLHFKK